ncbi:MAG: HlyD family efflux transporter periplasmic adaptor subunit [Oceanospirillaceae bacterium]|nr:HlyD family efflux transporter periplasmic adaptor subunit [Oceanospirillaceae bacterium]
MHFFVMALFLHLSVFMPLVYAEELPVVGRVVSDKVAVLSAPRSGLVVGLPFSETDRVTEGDLFLNIDCSVDKARRDAAAASANTLKLKYESQRKLKEYASTTGLEVAIAKSEWDRGVAEVAVHNRNLETCSVNVPFDAVVTDMLINEYEYVEEGKPIARILDDQALYIEFLAPVSWGERVKIDGKVTLRLAQNSRKVFGQIDRVAATVDSISQTVKVRAKIGTVPAWLSEGAVGYMVLEN